MSSTESALSTHGFLFTFLALYATGNVLLFVHAALKEAGRHTDFQRYTTSIARACGATLNLNLAAVLVVASRSLLSFLRESPLNMILPVDKAMPGFHSLAGLLILLAGIIHAVTHLMTYILKYVWSPGYSGFTSLFVSGILLVITMLAIRISAMTRVRQKSYETFYRLHVGGAVVAYALVVIHGIHLGSPSTWKWVIGPIVIYVADYGIRLMREHRSYLLLSKHAAAFHGSDVVKLRLPRVFHFEAGQYAEIKVPTLSRYQWHPFTIASAPHEPEMVFYVKAAGDWTNSLYQLFSERLQRESSADIEIHIRGPFGAPAQHVGQYDRVVLIGGGVGATPFCSVTKNAYNWIVNWSASSHKPSQARPPPASIWFNSLQRQRTRARKEEKQRLKEIERAAAADTAPIISQTHITLNAHDFMQTNVVTDGSLGVFSDFDSGSRNVSHVVASSAYRPNAEKPVENAPTQNKLLKVATLSEDGTFDDASMYTAREYLTTTLTESSSQSTATTSPSADEEPRLVLGRPDKEIIPSPAERKLFTTKAKKSRVRGFSQQFSQFSIRSGGATVPEIESEMYSYAECSTGTQQKSLDYLRALHSAYDEGQTNETYQRSLNMLVGMNFGSASLVRSVQLRNARRRVMQTGTLSLPFSVSTATEDLSIFQNPRIMLLLFMRSVTMSMVLLWVLLCRIVLAGFAAVFNELSLVTTGLAMYNLSSLIAVDLGLAMLITLLVAGPAIIEMIELRSLPAHGLDLFVLTPAAAFGVVVDILALAGVGKNVNLFGVFNVFVVWPLLGILITIRVLRVVGERIAQADNVIINHANTKSLDFFWTAPTSGDDAWLVQELLPYSDTPSVRLHRYLTRVSEPVREAWMDDYETPPIRTSFGRPDWYEVFNMMAERCDNNTTIGVFFCGPQGMGDAVQEASMGAMRNSIVRGLHAGAYSMRNLEDVFGDAITANEYTGDGAGANGGGGIGCNVRFVYRRESFG